MKFHSQLRDALDLPVLLGHFLPWYILDPGAFPLDPADEDTIPVLPRLEAMRHWNDTRAGYRRTHHHWPLHGVYDSRDPDTIRWQIQTALDHGFTGFSINWYGCNSVENVITLHVLRGIDRWNREFPGRPFHYLLSIDSQCLQATEGKEPVPLAADFAYIRRHLIRPSYIHRGHRPVFFVFPYSENVRAWTAAMAEVFGPDGADLLWMNRVPGLGETGAYPWILPDDAARVDGDLYPWRDPDNAGDGWLRRFYDEANAAPVKPAYLAGGAWPGFNDQLVSWAWNPNPLDPAIRPRVIARETTRGNTLDLTLGVYLDYLARAAQGDPTARVPAPLLQLATWNDYAETSTVEPTRDYGHAPLETCRSFITRARRIWSDGPDGRPGDPSTPEFSQRQGEARAGA